MARIRTIKPDFWSDERLTECSVSARLLFIGLLNFADDAGNLQRSTRKIKMQIFPAESFDCEPLILELIAQRVITEYSLNGEKYLNIKNFLKHQVINRPSKSSIPPMNEAINADTFTEDSLTEGKGKEGKGKETTEAAPLTLAAEPGQTSEALPVEKNEFPNPDLAAGIIAGKLRALGAKLNAMNPTVQAWANDGIGIERLTEAYAIAEMRKGKGKVTAEYMDPIARDKPKARKPYDDWDRSNEGIDRKGRELGIRAKGGESYHEYKGRIWSAIRLADKEVA